MVTRGPGGSPAHTRPSYASGGHPVPLLGETIGANFDRSVASHPDRDALVDRPTDRRWTYAELGAEVDALAVGLLDLGITKGDRVGLWSPNCAEWVLTQYAAAKVGAILVNINPAYRTHELEYVLGQAGVRLLVAARRFRSSDYESMIAEVAPRCPALEHTVLIGGESWLALRAPKDADGARRLAEAAALLGPDDPINIQYTSGTTGFPKGAVLSHHNILNNGFFTGELLDYTEADRVCLPVPFYHCFGMAMGTIAATSHGACVVIPSPVFDARAALEAVEAERCTSLYGVPTMFIAELNHPDFDSFDLSSLRTGIMSGSPCPVEVMTQVVEKMNMTQVTICYGMTETSPVACQTRPGDSLERRVSTVGRVGPHLEIKIVDPESGLTVPRGRQGEFCTRGYSVMSGYWEQPGRTAEAIDGAGWMHTGDLAVMDDEGYVSITGRIKDMVIRGGENLYPREIEEFLYTHPDILDAQVIGVPDEYYGEELMAWVRMREGAEELTPRSLRAFCTGKLAHYKIPRYVRTVDAFPMTASGKVRKVELREQAVALLELGSLEPALAR
ncbi:AMP-binding protein [Streptomyces sp. H34-S4]|uniref:AMP-binding protein n=1 Tax=Streptomyces sp. H34-S4 TaxID=2996463 RepID=UPI00226F0E8F|nr:AMP-binding protein [Streptomyces sp. H34-S4]MCY0938947.1 AMP-binding protein [Streptomyces sp. H34-S4]